MIAFIFAPLFLAITATTAVSPGNVTTMHAVNAASAQDARTQLRSAPPGTLVRYGKRWYRSGPPGASPRAVLGAFTRLSIAGTQMRSEVVGQSQTVELPPPGEKGFWLAGYGFPCGTTLCSIHWPPYPLKEINHIDYGNPKDASGKCIETNYAWSPQPCPGDEITVIPDEPCKPKYCAYEDTGQSGRYYLSPQWSFDHVEASEDCKYYAVRTSTGNNILDVALDPPSRFFQDSQLLEVENQSTNPTLTCAVKVFVTGPKGTLWGKA
ncbi:MAG: hypothetical protein M3M96_00770 [Candidatus Eremiobacteraeota bacterium]|nr:hypothetical protein [Candidatus Eremiobacteraeota bacterium]